MTILLITRDSYVSQSNKATLIDSYESISSDAIKRWCRITLLANNNFYFFKKNQLTQSAVYPPFIKTECS